MLITPSKIPDDQSISSIPEGSTRSARRTLGSITFLQTYEASPLNTLHRAGEAVLV